MEKAKNLIPEISDEVLSERLTKIKFVTQAMCGLDGKPYHTEEEDEKLFDLFYVESKVDPRTQSFNFDENKKMTERAVGLTEICSKDVFIKVGGYHGFLKMTMAEVLSQIPEDVLDQVVAFSLNPKKETKVIRGGDYQLAPIIFYGKTESVQEENLPSSEGLIKTLDYQKAERLKNQVKPILNFGKDGYSFLEPGNINESFMDIGIWIRINGSNLHRRNDETKVLIPYKQGKKISVYAAFTNGADSFMPTYAHTISQVPDNLITENTIGLLYHSTDYFKTKEGVLHKTEYTLIEKK